MRTRHQHGFSLVELMVAMTITLIVSAAIYGLLTSGSNAFRREPELADRQQNIRMAMDLVARDVFNAGAGLPTYSQVFTRSDPPNSGRCTGAEGVNGCGVPGTLGVDAATKRAPGDPGGDPSTSTDVLELVASDEQCPVLTVCNSDPAGTMPGAAGTFVTRQALPACLRSPGLALLTDNTSFLIQPAQAVTPASKSCAGGATTSIGNLALGVLGDPDFRGPVASMSAPSPSAPLFLYPARIVRYSIGPGLDPADPTIPALWRSETGRFTATGAVGPKDPGEDTSLNPSGSQWEIVARGIEDLQVEYMAGDGLWHSLPPISLTVPPSPAAAAWSTLVRQVRITLSARASAANLQGQTNAGGAPPAVRGQLSTTVAPRAAFNELQMGSQIK